MNHRTSRFNQRNNMFAPCMNNYYDIPSFIETVEFGFEMCNSTHYNKIPNTVKNIKYNILRISYCDYFYLERNKTKIIQYSKTKYQI